MLTRRPARAAACALAVAAAAAAGGCGPEEEEVRREGLALELEGVTYNVFITRQLNLADPEDQGYVELDPPPSDATYYGVFLEACNVGDEVVEPASDFKVVDTQGDEFEPLELEEGNDFAYEPRPLEPGDCVPEEGSVANTAPTGGSLLVFELPLEAAENRPLELEVREGFDLEAGEPHELLIELDI